MSSKSIFSQIIDRELPADILFENERILVIRNINPEAPVHLLGITKQPFENLHDLLQTDNRDLLWELMTKLDELAKEQGIDATGYRLVSNNGPDAHQTIHHLHVHLLGGELLQTKDPEPNS